jgi:hypothetical protein
MIIFNIIDNRTFTSIFIIITLTFKNITITLSFFIINKFTMKIN